jgi:hypothetical protein
MGRTRKPPDKATGHRQHPVVALANVQAEPAPPPPSGLLQSSRQRWAAFWSSEVSKAIDRGSDLGGIERWICAVDEHARASRVFRTARLVKGHAGQPRINPLAGYMAQLETTIARAEEAYGMHPMARLRLGIALGQAQQSLQEYNAALEASAADDDERLRIVREMHGSANKEPDPNSSVEFAAALEPIDICHPGSSQRTTRGRKSTNGAFLDSDEREPDKPA